MVNYVCELVAIPGKMNVEKALALGVPSGPLLGKLQKGEDVTLKNGVVVRRNNVLQYCTTALRTCFDVML